MAISDTYYDNVFINCPFDRDYWPMMQAITFTIYSCGFYPYCSLKEADGTEFRLNKIYLLIEDCKYGIHDISRTELDEQNNLPRFNMPFELGLFFSSKKFGNDQHKQKRALILDREQYRYQTFISDLRGMDINSHDNNPNNIITIIRQWLHTNSRRTTIPGHLTILTEFEQFNNDLPESVELAGLDLENLGFNDYCYFVEEWLKFKVENNDA